LFRSNYFHALNKNDYMKSTMAERNSPRADAATHMPTLVDFNEVDGTIAEVIARCETAQENFRRINDELQRTIQQSQLPPAQVFLDEERARQRLFDAQVSFLDRLKAIKKAQLDT
jgi:organic radical activating enzyme